MAETNLGTVQANLKDVHEGTLSDEVQFTFVNQNMRSLDRRTRVDFRGNPATITDIPAAPTGLYEVFITPRKYREKNIFLNVPAGSAAVIDETFFVEPGAVSPVFPSFATFE